ncbi:uncharacterized protein BO95DRAFT_443287 [Aspergillus brunneoviolaceus CBS 621.78]|uniref:Uncharacterized protein n=1 Tax=Aspergillus brunneoviolaceus CBS 621.78 TaxID=1450534 RepID=A0ACD1G855_9EURO|nr:hypothetical protein BO95DRAFT_443287 [Aspergillus brunneoviolaceus CBS 621.78]RAH45352.1 hypothetical protein BO95DRAFT_443287 [Aspergillus brunneoviolaceus CBS 621.78]
MKSWHRPWGSWGWAGRLVGALVVMDGINQRPGSDDGGVEFDAEISWKTQGEPARATGPKRSLRRERRVRWSCIAYQGYSRLERIIAAMMRALVRQAFSQRCGGLNEMRPRLGEDS